MANIAKMNINGVAYDVKDKTAQDIINVISDLSETITVDLNTAPIIDCTINTNNKWAAASGTAYMIPLHGCNGVRIEAKNNTDIVYAVLTSSSVTAGQAPDFSALFTARVVLSSGSVADLTLPYDAKYLYCTRTNASAVDRRPSAVILFKENDLKDELEIEKISESYNDWAIGYNYKLTVSNFDINTKTSSPSMKCLAVPCSPGDIFAYIGKGASQARPYGFASSASGTGNILSYASSTSYTTRTVFTAPANAAYLIVNAYQNVDSYIHKLCNKHYVISNSNLNDMLTDGDYYCENGTIANTLTNFPSNLPKSGFCLTVKSLAYEQSGDPRHIQILIIGVTSETSFGIAYRIHKGTAFGSWKYLMYPGMPDIPAPPSTNGTYKLSCTVSGGTPTYSWVSG